MAGLQLPIHVAQVKENTNFSEVVSGALVHKDWCTRIHLLRM